MAGKILLWCLVPAGIASANGFGSAASAAITAPVSPPNLGVRHPALTAPRFLVNTTTTQNSSIGTAPINTNPSATTTSSSLTPLSTAKICGNATKPVNLKTDAQNCGACGHVCDSGACENGYCGYHFCNNIPSCFTTSDDGSTPPFRFPCTTNSNWITENMCGCMATFTGTGFCGIMEANAKCADSEKRCESSNDCAPDELCVRTPCCNLDTNNGAPDINVCRKFRQCSPFGNSSFAEPEGAVPSPTFPIPSDFKAAASANMPGATNIRGRR